MRHQTAVRGYWYRIHERLAPHPEHREPWRRWAVGPWVAFELFDKLSVDSARWQGGGPANVFKGKDSGLLWVNLGGRLKAGEVKTLRLVYHGDMIDRIIDFFRIKNSVGWYPVSLEGRTLATFDLTFNTPDAYLLASVGERVDSSRTGHLVTTRWVTPAPIRNASFNLGLFKDYTVADAGIPPVWTPTWTTTTPWSTRRAPGWSTCCGS